MTWKSKHFLMKLLEGQGSDFALILQHYGVDRSRLTTELQRSLDRLKSGKRPHAGHQSTVLKMLTKPGCWRRSTMGPRRSAPALRCWRC